MADPIVLTKTLTAGSANCIAQSQTPTSGTPLTLNGSAVSGGVAILDTQRRVLLTFGNEASNRTLVVNGTREDGTKISETLQIPSGAGATVATEQDFLTVTSAVPGGGGWSAAATLGTNTTGSTRWVLMNQHIVRFDLGLEYELLSGTQTVSVEQTMNSPLPPLPIYQNGYSQTPPVPTPFNVSGMDSLSSSTIGAQANPCAAVRLTVTAGTGNGRLTILPQGIMGP